MAHHWWGNFYQNCDDDGICCGAVLLLNICYEKCSYKQKIYGTLTHIDGNDDSDDDVNDVHMVYGGYTCKNSKSLFMVGPIGVRQQNKTKMCSWERGS